MGPDICCLYQKGKKQYIFKSLSTQRYKRSNSENSKNALISGLTLPQYSYPLLSWLDAVSSNEETRVLLIRSSCAVGWNAAAVSHSPENSSIRLVNRRSSYVSWETASGKTRFIHLLIFFNSEIICCAFISLCLYIKLGKYDKIRQLNLVIEVETTIAQSWYLTLALVGGCQMPKQVAVTSSKVDEKMAGEPPLLPSFSVI